ncbi:PP2C family protein-serine/threonine phosphatase [Clostridium fungisolvens]|uniref:PPM-type phosphatase domain-containing protein n=1 Tax=Clostridium fungisolvens TaxID=1604897 RepID=A0A6V8SFJ2_9CLOT|nr:protein phosphatase 2C domain-containing protein [Clostridium fungisolvens]GFP75486.1 hypothetical protein bsdtw1_01566 [Clostridium fungisolvens]
MGIRKVLIALCLILIATLFTTVALAEEENFPQIISITTGDKGENCSLVWLGKTDENTLSNINPELLVNKGNGEQVAVKPEAANPCGVDYVVFFERLKNYDMLDAIVTDNKKTATSPSHNDIKTLMDGLRSSDTISFVTYNEEFNRNFNSKVKFKPTDIGVLLKQYSKEPVAQGKNYLDILNEQDIFKNKNDGSRAILVVRFTDSSKSTLTLSNENSLKNALVFEGGVTNQGFDSTGILEQGRGYYLLNFKYDLSSAKSVILKFNGKSSKEFMPQPSEKKITETKPQKEVEVKPQTFLQKTMNFIRNIAFILIFAGCLLLIACIFLLHLLKKGRGKSNMIGKNGKIRTLKLDSMSSGANISIGNAQNIGRREEQQDSFAISDISNKQLYSEKGIFAVIADGMGGLANGRVSSNIVVESLLRYFSEQHFISSAQIELRNMIISANEKLLDYLHSTGNGRSGSTAIAVIIKEYELYWISVGDSRIYLYRGNRLYTLTRDHAYVTELLQKAIKGKIDFEEVLTHPDRRALTSYMGVEQLTDIDQNIKAFHLQPGDKVLLCSDGIYGSLDETEMAKVLMSDPQTSAFELEQRVLEKAYKGQDNLTTVVIGIE